MNIALPQLGEGIDEAEVRRVLVEPGDKLEVDQPILELESDKASFEVPSTAAGTVSKVLVSVGDTVETGQDLVSLDEDDDAKGDDEEETSEDSDAEDSDAEDSDDEDSDAEDSDDEDSDAEDSDDEDGDAEDSDAEDSDAEDSDDEEVTDDETEAEDGDEDGDEDDETEPEASDEDDETEADRPVRASPGTRKLARELGVDIASVRMSADASRIKNEDVLASARGEAPAKEVPLTRIQKTAAKRLEEAWKAVVHVTHHDDADVTDLEADRQRIAEDTGPDATPSWTAIVTYAVARTLREYPRLASAFDAKARTIALPRSIDIGIAVEVGEDLLVPVLRRADTKSLTALSQELAELVHGAQNHALQAAAYRGGCFSISNLGTRGGRGFTPIVMPPEVAILGVAASSWQPVVDPATKAVAPRLLLPLSLSYDHRVVNGAQAARFVTAVAQRLRSGLRLVL